MLPLPMVFGTPSPQNVVNVNVSLPLILIPVTWFGWDLARDCMESQGYLTSKGSGVGSAVRVG